jgi:hypothetical protein
MRRFLILLALLSAGVAFAQVINDGSGASAIRKYKPPTIVIDETLGGDAVGQRGVFVPTANPTFTPTATATATATATPTSTPTATPTP